jgi:hypothetical protein
MKIDPLLNSMVNPHFHSVVLAAAVGAGTADIVDTAAAAAAAGIAAGQAGTAEVQIAVVNIPFVVMRHSYAVVEGSRRMSFPRCSSAAEPLHRWWAHHQVICSCDRLHLVLARGLLPQNCRHDGQRHGCHVLMYRFHDIRLVLLDHDHGWLVDIHPVHFDDCGVHSVAWWNHHLAHASS